MVCSRPHGRIGFTELLIMAVVGLLPFGLAFVLGFFVGKSVGLKEGLGEAERLNRAQQPPNPR